MLTYTNVANTDNAASVIWGSGGLGVSSTQIALFAGLRVIVDEQMPVICNDERSYSVLLRAVWSWRGSNWSAIPSAN